MADSEQQNTPIPSLAQQWSLQEKEQQPDLSEVPLGKTTEDTNPVEITSSDSAEEKTEETPVANESAVAEQIVEATEEVAEAVEEVEEAAEEQSEIKIETAPADFRFPTTNQTRHCFTRYIEYHRCIAAKGEDASECNKFAKYYRALCPGEWVDRWNEQRENGTFPGPL